MKQKQRILALLLAAGLAFGSFGCGTQEIAGNNKVGSSTPQVSTADDVSQEPIYSEAPTAPMAGGENPLH